MNAARARRAPAQAGQTIVIFALASIVLLGMMAFVFDTGYDYVQRREMQNAADAAALAGVQLLARNPLTIDIYQTVTSIAYQNGVPTTAAVDCQYITDANQDGGPACRLGVTVPLDLSAITGVKVTVRETHANFGMRLLGNATSGTSATAVAQLQVLGGYPGTAVPFVACGVDTALVGGGKVSILNTKTKLTGYQRIGFLDVPIYGNVARDDASGQASINPLAYGYDWTGALGLGLTNPLTSLVPTLTSPQFLIHGANVANCGQQGTFDGRNYTSATITLPALAADNPNGGTRQTLTIDPTTQNGVRNVPGLSGCKVGQYNNCVVILPIADTSGSANGLAGRVWGAFWMKQIDLNTHGAYLIANYPLSGDGNVGWRPGYGGPIITRLIR